MTLPNIEEGLQTSERDRSEFDLSIAIMTGIGANEESHKRQYEPVETKLHFTHQHQITKQYLNSMVMRN